MDESHGVTLYGVIGHPIGHSLSPLMHNTAFEALGIKASMSAYDIEPASLKDALEGFLSAGFGGLNVTIPHKETIIPFLDSVDEEASIVGAVNTVKFDGDRTSGFNTDIHGFLRTLEPYRSSLEGAKFLVLGAGGAARAVVYVLLKYFRTSQVHVASRSTSRAHDFAEHFKSTGQGKLSVLNLADGQITRVFEASDVVVNATPAGMTPNVEDMPLAAPPFRRGQIAVDLIYRPLRTKFLQEASKANSQPISGLEMFVQQGARSFEFWTGRTFDTDLIRKVITQKLEQET